MTQPAYERLSFLHHISQMFNSSFDLDEVLKYVVDESITATGAERCLVALCDPDKHLVFRAAQVIDPSNAPDMESPREFIERVARSGQPLLSSDTVRSMLCVPLQFKTAITCLIYVDRLTAAGFFQQSDLGLLSAIGSSAVFAIESARRYEDATRSSNELHRLYETMLDVTSQLELSRLLDAMTYRARDLLDGNSSMFYRYDASLDILAPIVPDYYRGDPPPHLKPGDGVAGKAFETGEPFCDKEFYRWEGSPYLEQVLGVPVQHGANKLGVMNVYRLREDPPFNEHDRQLLLLFANQAAIAIENARLYEVAIEKGRMERELQVAREVQARLIPQEVPQVSGWDFGALWNPAHLVSGDFYDFIERGTDRAFPRQGIVIADVADKGMPAALFMTLTRSVVRASVAAHTLVDWITQANNTICPDATDGNFVTAFCAELDSATGEISYVNAGHNPPLFFHGKEKQFSELARTGIALALFEAAPYEQRRIQLCEGDLVLMYTDGVTDATNTLEQNFGVERLRRVILECCDGSAADIVGGIERALREFVGSATQFDDITIVAVKRT